MFSGSYNSQDIKFLLKVININENSITKKEEKIQKGIHYSEMLGIESIPSKRYLSIFHQGLEDNLNQFSQDMLNFAYNLQKKDNFIIISLARGGTPIGVILTQIIRKRYNKIIPHYSISIIRDKGIDFNAIKYILTKHKNKKLIFVDGWTGKGVINFELKRSIKKFNNLFQTTIKPHLFVVADISGKADFSVTNQDYFIPSSALNSTISGLISRTVLNSKIKNNNFHGCKFYKEFKTFDLSNYFIDKVVKKSFELIPTLNNFLTKNKKLEKKTDKFLQNISKEFNITNKNYLKPAIGETTRVLLRRVPHLIIVKNLKNNNIKHILQLAKEKNIKVKVRKNLPYLALGIIKNLKGK